jgi:hypothetical protein
MWVFSLTALCLAVLVSAGSSIAAADPSPVPLASASPAPASPIDVARGRIDAMLRTGHADPAWFSATFLAQVPPSKIDEVIASLKSSLGEYRSVELSPVKFVAHFAKGTDDGIIHLDENNKIDGLFFRPPVIASSSLEDALHALRPATGDLSYVIVEEGRPERAALNASEPLAVGSAFKLAVMNAVADEIARGSRRWTDVVPLDDRWKSLPSGVLRTWPAGTPLTLATYAAQMISISDNTAADALVRIVGPNALQAYAGQNQPFLTTREAFTLKSVRSADVRAAYLASTTPAARAAVLKRVDALPLPAAGELLTKPDPAVEWHYSVRALCGLMRRVADLPLMSINPGPAEPAAFRHVAFKGGSDVGVINLTTMVTTRRGTKICFSATLNDAEQPVDELKFSTAYAGVMRYLADD